MSIEVFASSETIRSISSSDYLCLFIHYNEFGHLNKSLINIVRLLGSRNISSVITTPYLNPGSRDCALRNFDYLIVRPNVGRDFGAIIDFSKFLSGFESLRFKKLLIFNNSMVQLLSIQKFSAYLEYLLDESRDLSGITSSYGSGYYHIQTYHFSLSRIFFESIHFSEFMMTYDMFSKDREYAVREGEVRLSQVALSNGYACAAYYDWPHLYNPEILERLSNAISELSSYGITSTLLEAIHLDSLAIRASNNLKYNPTHSNWLLMLLDGYPFIKRELLEVNPLGLHFHYILPSILKMLNVDRCHDCDLGDLNLLLRLPKDWSYDYSRLQSAAPPPIT